MLEGPGNPGNRNTSTISRTKTGENTKNVGTSWYIAPEVLKSGRYTSKVDIFSLGICFFEMCNKKIPLGGQLRMEYLIKLRQNPSIISDINNEEPEYKIIEKMVKHEADTRPSVEELIKAIPIEFAVKDENVFNEEFIDNLYRSVEKDPQQLVQKIVSRLDMKQSQQNTTQNTDNIYRDHLINKIRLDQQNLNSISFSDRLKSATIHQNVLKQQYHFINIFLYKRNYTNQYKTINFDLNNKFSNSKKFIHPSGLLLYEEKNYFQNFLQYKIYEDEMGKNRQNSGQNGTNIMNLEKNFKIQSGSNNSILTLGFQTDNTHPNFSSILAVYDCLLLSEKLGYLDLIEKLFIPVEDDTNHNSANTGHTSQDHLTLRLSNKKLLQNCVESIIHKLTTSGSSKTLPNFEKDYTEYAEILVNFLYSKHFNNLSSHNIDIATELISELLPEFKNSSVKKIAKDLLNLAEVEVDDGNMLKRVVKNYIKRLPKARNRPSLSTSITSSTSLSSQQSELTKILNELDAVKFLVESTSKTFKIKMRLLNKANFNDENGNGNFATQILNDANDFCFDLIFNNSLTSSGKSSKRHNEQQSEKQKQFNFTTIFVGGSHAYYSDSSIENFSEKKIFGCNFNLDLYRVVLD